MPWDTQTLIQPDRNAHTFSKEISIAEDDRLASKIQEMSNEVINIDRPFLYFAIGTANESANKTNPSFGDFVTDENIFMQQQPDNFIQSMERNNYTPLILNIDCFSEKAQHEPEKYFNGVFPLAGKVSGRESSASIIEIGKLFLNILNRDGKIFLLNAVADLKPAKTNNAPYEFLMFRGIEMLLSSPSFKDKRQSFVYASSYLQVRNYFNLYRYLGVIRKNHTYFSNLNVSYEKLLYENVFMIVEE